MIFTSATVSLEEDHLMIMIVFIFNNDTSNIMIGQKFKYDDIYICNSLPGPQCDAS